MTPRTRRALATVRFDPVLQVDELSHEHLFFEPDEPRSRETVVLRSQERVKAWRCRECGTTALAPADIAIDPVQLSRRRADGERG